MKKLLFRGFLVIVVLLVVGVVALYFSLNSIVHNQVEEQGTQATGVQTLLASANLNPFGGQLALNDFSIANPQGFSDSKIFQFGEADVKVNLMSLLSGEEVVVPHVNLNGATILVELDGLNLNTLKLLENIQGTDPDADPEPSAEGEARGFLIQNLNIRNTKVIGRLKLPGGIDQDVDLQLADISKTDVRGVELSDLIAFAVETVMVNASREIVDIAPNLDQLRGQLETLANDTLGNVGARADEAIGNVGNRVDQVLPGAGDAVRNAGDELKKSGGEEVNKALEGLFGDKKKEEPAETQE